MYKPSITKPAYIAKESVVKGNVIISEDCSVWFNATIRGEQGSIKIGKGTNVQDNCVIHCETNNSVTIGEYCTLGHGAIVHGCKVGNNCLIGMGAIILNDAIIGDNCIVGAGSLVTERSEFESGSLILGSPARVKRKLTEEEINKSVANAQHYIEKAKQVSEGEMYGKN